MPISTRATEMPDPIEKIAATSASPIHREATIQIFILAS
jgi:hypothetical protein